MDPLVGSRASLNQPHNPASFHHVPRSVPWLVWMHHLGERWKDVGKCGNHQPESASHSRQLTLHITACFQDPSDLFWADSHGSLKGVESSERGILASRALSKSMAPEWHAKKAHALRTLCTLKQSPWSHCVLLLCGAYCVYLSYVLVPSWTSCTTHCFLYSPTMQCQWNHMIASDCFVVAMTGSLAGSKNKA